MDIPSLSMQLSQNSVQMQAGVSLLKSSIDMMKTNGAGVVSLIDSARAPLAEGSGTQIDVYA
jgi:hypothetical protein